MAQTASSLSDAYLNADERGGTAPNDKPSLTIDEAAVQLTRYGLSWADAWGEAVTVTFAFRSTAPSDMPDDTSGFSRFSAAQINATLLALQAWSDVANITFNRVGTGYSNSATILFGNYSSGSEGAAAFAYYPYSFAYSSVDGDVWVNSTLSYNTNPQLFYYGQLVLVHEIGHAIGISHPGDYDADPDIDITYAEHAEYFEDSMQYSVMSYFYESYTGASYGSPYPATVMLDDIAAAQRLYGANMSTRTGDTVYGFNSNADRPWFVATSASFPLIFAVWDAGGTDTFDFSGYASSQKIDLRQGFFSDVGGLIGNVAVAKNAVIENAIGGSGADNLTGNGSANRLQGNGGADTLTGLGGADVFVFTQSGGADIVTDFTVGTDKLDATAFGDYISIAQSGSDTLVTFAAGDTARLTGITASTVTNASFIGLTDAQSADVTVTGTSGADILYGGAGNDTLYGLAGPDRLDGKAGADAMYGGSGNDIYYVDNAGDAVVEAAEVGTDIVQSSVTFTLGDNVENLTLTGTAPVTATGNALANVLTGNAAANLMVGGDGYDRIDGKAGADTMRGGLGNDLYFVDRGSDVVTEYTGEGADRVVSSVSYALGADLENLTLAGSAAINGTGNSLANAIQGNGAANTLNGRDGADRLKGMAGDDVLIGGAGADQLTGGEGADKFVYKTLSESAGADMDRIFDFNPLTDVIDLTALDANGSLSGNQAFHWVGAFTHHAGEAVLIYSAASNQTTLTLDTNGDALANFTLRIDGNVTGDSGFLL